LFIPLRQLQRWLHQHVFKVGWLLTKNFQTTTILYYTFLLPGVVLYEFSFWLVAGLLNVRADRAISWPQKQEIAELKLNFVKLHKSAGAVKVGVISLAPLVVGVVAVWHIAVNIIHVGDFLNLMRSGRLADLGTGIGALTSAPDFWLWVYIIFAISNTMMPNLKDLHGLRIIGVVAAVIAAGLFLIGVGDEVILLTLNGPVASALNVLAGVFAVMVVVNLVMTAILGLIEAIIERITGDSATFVNGKLVAMTRAELLAQRAKEAEQARKARQAKDRTPARAGPPSVYNLSFPIPGAPGKEAVTQSEAVIVESEKPPTLQPGTPRDARAGPAVISGAVTEKLPAPSTAPRASPTFSGPSPASPVVRPPGLTPTVRVEEPEPDEEEIESAPVGANKTDFEDEETVYDELDDGDDEEEDVGT
jgi:hypothetical protein